MKYQDIPILMYHDINDLDNPWCVSLKDFEEQMNFLKENSYQTISLTELAQGIKENKITDEKLVLITFDDGRKRIYTHVYPLLKGLGFTTTIYIVPQWIEGKDIPLTENYSSFMDWSELKELSQNGFEIGSHSFSHQNMAQMSEDDILKEIKDAEWQIMEKLGKKVKHFSYPLGKINPELIKIVGKWYQTAVTVQKGFQKVPGNYARQWVTKDTSLTVFKKILSSPTISLCMIVKNEEKYLQDCLNSVKGLVDEIIIVDTGSIDKTKEIALSFGAKVYDFTWVNDFSEARNESLKHATGDWILVLDADEIIAEEDYTQIKQGINAWEVAGFRIMTRNYSNQSSSSGWQPVSEQDPYAKSFQGWFPSLKVRLFQRKKGHHFQGEIHEMVDQSITQQSGMLATLPFPIHHYGAEGKSAQYLELTKKKILDNPPDAKTFFELGVQYKQLNKFDLAEESFQQSIELDSVPLIPLLNLALVQQKQGKIDLAVKNYLQAIEKNHSHPEIHFGLGYCYFVKNDLTKAKEHFLLAAQYNPLYLDAHINLGAVCEKQGKLDEAEIALFKAIELSPRNARVHYNLGVVYEKGMAIKPAIECYEKAIRFEYSRGEELKEKVVKMKRFLEEEKDR